MGWTLFGMLFLSLVAYGCLNLFCMQELPNGWPMMVIRSRALIALIVGVLGGLGQICLLIGKYWL